MAKYSPVGPIAILEELERINLLGDYLLVLAHDVLMNLDRYKDLLARQDHIHVILDNSAVELGKPITENLVELFYAIGADAIVLPDVIGSRDGTLEAIEYFLESISGLKACTLPWMGVPQGENIIDILDCAHGIKNLLGRNPHYWGVPRWIANKIGSRSFIINILDKPEFTPFACAYQNIHLLGMSTNLEDDLRCCKMSGVAGIDSANPVVLGLKHQDMFTQYSHSDRREVVDHGSPYGEEVVFDYWEETKLNDQAIANIVKLRSVIQ